MSPMHALTESLPSHLKAHVAQQDPSLYTAIDHANWRFIMKLSRSFFAEHGHPKYLEGLKTTGISTERIPLIKDMDQLLRKFNWRAVPVTGFIPPAAFMEFLSLGVLPIACDMRQPDHLAYTPAPDIVHEAAGHAPILADPDYAAYLRSYGEISRKAIYSTHDLAIYEAIRILSDTKEDPKSTAEELKQAQANLESAYASQSETSEATLLSRMGWWTFEYGLVGSMDNPKIFGAGLFSSLMESYHCYDPQVKKVPFSVDCVEVNYDITRPQPQLFVTPDFETLGTALEELASRMAFRKGGSEGLQKARRAGTVTTTQLDTGIQVSGVLSEILSDQKGNPVYLKFTGPTQISYQDKELPGQGANYHSQGYSTPIESVSETINDASLLKAGLAVGKTGTLSYESGITVEGRLEQCLKRDDRIILLTFDSCTVKRGSEILFRPEWGKYDLICGSQVTSVFGGPADQENYLKATGLPAQSAAKPKTNLTKENKQLNECYVKFQNLRIKGQWFNMNQLRELEALYFDLRDHHPDDWLLRYQILELTKSPGLQIPWEAEIRAKLEELSQQSPEKKELIQRGLKVI